jgi:hypothetical protein
MKKQILMLFIVGSSFGLIAQSPEHDYDDEHLIFHTATNSDPKVGIGIDDPEETLHVKGSLLLNAFANEEGLYFRGGGFNGGLQRYNLSILSYN